MKLDKSKVDYIDVDLNGTCNLACPMCTFNYLDVAPPNHMPLEKWIDIFDEYKSLSIVYLAGAYSEPTLYRHLIGLCEYFVRRNVKVSINTNGSARSDSFWKELAAVLTERDEVFFDIDGSTPELHATYRVNSKLEKVLHNASVFRNKNKNDHAQTIRFKYNDHDIDNIKEMVKREGFNKHIIVHSDKLNKCWKYPYKQEFDTDKISAIEPIQRKYDALHKLGMMIVENRENREIICQSIERRSVHMDHYGTVQPCCAWKEKDIKDWDEDYSHILDFQTDVCYMCEKTFAKAATELGVYGAYVF